MHSSQFDVAIVGASLAGCAAARLFAQRGFSVALLEKQADPEYYKPICTHYLLSSATPTLARLGLIEALEAEGAIQGNHHVWTPWGWIPHVHQPGIPEHGYSLPREILDPMLRQLAVAEPKVAFFPGHTLKDIEKRSKGETSGLVFQTPQGDARTISARLYVGADGRVSKLAKLAGVPEEKFENNRFLYYRYFRNLPLKTGTDSQLWMLNSDLAYCFPNPNGVTLAVAMINKAHHDSFKQNIEQNLVKFIERLPGAPDFAVAEPIGPAQGMYDLSLYSRKAGGNGIALIGDAALTTDPIAGAGCGWALQSAEWLVDCVTPELAANNALAPALGKYAALHAKNLHQHQKIIAKYSAAPPFLAGDGALFSLLARDTKMQQWFHAIYSRNKQPAMSMWLALKLLLRSLRANPPIDHTNYNWEALIPAAAE
jgi:2-polyprenyl-6-methoxyphenol hydroxylase-like FAD-dependent oxidoreductase